MASAIALSSSASASFSWAACQIARHCFRMLAQRICQPALALLERNCQRHRLFVKRFRKTVVARSDRIGNRIDAGSERFFETALAFVQGDGQSHCLVVQRIRQALVTARDGSDDRFRPACQGVLKSAVIVGQRIHEGSAACRHDAVNALVSGIERMRDVFSALRDHHVQFVGATAEGRGDLLGACGNGRRQIGGRGQQRVAEFGRAC
jgi:hypothetical protein